MNFVVHQEYNLNELRKQNEHFRRKHPIFSYLPQKELPPLQGLWQGLQFGRYLDDFPFDPIREGYQPEQERPYSGRKYLACLLRLHSPPLKIREIAEYSNVTEGVAKRWCRETKFKERQEEFQKGFIVFFVRTMGDIYLRGEQRSWLAEWNETLSKLNDDLASQVIREAQGKLLHVQQGTGEQAPARAISIEEIRGLFEVIRAFEPGGKGKGRTRKAVPAEKRLLQAQMALTLISMSMESLPEWSPAAYGKNAVLKELRNLVGDAVREGEASLHGLQKKLFRQKG